MGIFDIVLIVLFFGFVGAGFYFGLIHTLGALFGVVLGVIIASSLYAEVAPFLEFFMLKEPVARLLAFIILFVAVSRLTGWVVYTIDKGFKIIRFIPFATTVNRLAGGLLGFFEATLVLGTILYVASHFQISPELNNAIESSSFAGLLMSVANILTPLIPAGIKDQVLNQVVIKII